MDEGFMNELFENELTSAEYGEIITHCCEQLDRLGYYVVDPYGTGDKDETRRLMEADYD